MKQMKVLQMKIKIKKKIKKDQQMSLKKIKQVRQMKNKIKLNQ